MMQVVVGFDQFVLWLLLDLLLIVGGSGMLGECFFDVVIDQGLVGWLWVKIGLLIVINLLVGVFIDCSG